MIDYDPHQWRRHLLDFRGTMLKELSFRVLWIALWSAGVVSLFGRYPAIAVPSTAHALVGVALGLLLVFRTNASYDRFWEGRKLWGGVVNESRNLARNAHVLMQSNPSLLKETLQWAALFPFAVMHKLRGTELRAPGFETDPPGTEVSALSRGQHPALATAVKITACVERARKAGVITDFQQGIIDQNIQQLVDYLGACERIHKTPLPFAYVVHLRRALLLYCLSVPFALAESYGWQAVTATSLIAFVFLGIEEIGVEIEDPFGVDANDLPLERICETIRKDVSAL